MIGKLGKVAWMGLDGYKNLGLKGIGLLLEIMKLIKVDRLLENFQISRNLIKEERKQIEKMRNK